MAQEVEKNRSPDNPVQVGRPRRKMSRRKFLIGAVTLAGTGVLAATGINRFFETGTGEPPSTMHEVANRSVESARAELDPHTLKAIVDMTTNTTFVVDSQGNV